MTKLEKSISVELNRLYVDSIELVESKKSEKSDVSYSYFKVETEGMNRYIRIKQMGTVEKFIYFVCKYGWIILPVFYISYQWVTGMSELPDYYSTEYLLLQIWVNVCNLGLVGYILVTLAMLVTGKLSTIFTKCDSEFCYNTTKEVDENYKIIIK